MNIEIFKKKIKICKKEFIREIKQNCRDQSITEHAFWISISGFIIILGFVLKVSWWLAFLTGIVVYLGTLALRVHKQAVLMVATLFYIMWTFSLNSQNLEMLKTSFELDYRPLVSVNMVRPIRKTEGDDVFYGDPITLNNKGKIPASDIVTQYYITTDVDKSNVQLSKWYDENIGGFGSITFLPPGAKETEYGYRSLNKAAKYYYFEALTTYRGMDIDTKYWMHTIKVYRVWQRDGVLSPAERYGTWDRNKNFTPPELSTQKEVEELLESIKSKTKVDKE